MSNTHAALVEALNWYAEQARLCRLIHAEGDAGRHALASDGGQRARAALTQAEAAQPVDPMDWPLPCDVTVGNVTLVKGSRLRALVLRMETLHQQARAAAKPAA